MLVVVVAMLYEELKTPQEILAAHEAKRSKAKSFPVNDDEDADKATLMAPANNT